MHNIYANISLRSVPLQRIADGTDLPSLFRPFSESLIVIPPLQRIAEGAPLVDLDSATKVN